MWSNKRGVSLLFALCIGVVAISGCSTVTVYQSPVAQFQTSVTAASDGVKTYLLGVNDVIAKGNLYDKIGMSVTNGGDWAGSDLAGGISTDQIQLRLQALGTISSYANALGAIAESKDAANLAQAAKSLGDSVNGLNATVAKIDPKEDKLAGNLGAPITALVTFFGTIVIHHEQNTALEKAIIDGATNVDAIIDQLKLDLPKFTALIDTSENAIWQGKLRIYNQLRKSASPGVLDNLITQCVADYDSIQQLRQAQVTSLLSNMENAHKALVVFAKSGKSPKDLAALADEINIFGANVQLFNAALLSIQNLVQPPVKTSK